MIIAIGVVFGWVLGVLSTLEYMSRIVSDEDYIHVARSEGHLCLLQTRLNAGDVVVGARQAQSSWTVSTTLGTIGLANFKAKPCFYWVLVCEFFF